VNSNYYLSLLNKKVKELKKVLKELEDENYSYDYKKYLISGYIIMLDSILEIGIGDLHSVNMDELTSLIYYTRQKAVHYGYFNGLHNIEDTANRIIELTEQNFEKEQEYYKNLFDLNTDYVCNNVVIKNSNHIEDDIYFYKFKSKDGKQVLCVPLKRIFKLTERNKEKIDSYIIDTTNPVALYTFEDNAMQNYKEIYSDEIKEFFRNNFSIENEDYNEHNVTMQTIIDSFVTDPINSIQIMEYSSDEQFCKNTIEVIKEFITENSLLKMYIDHHHLIKDKYSLNKMARTDFTKLQKIFRGNISNHLTHKDIFFIETTMRRAKFYCDVLQDNTQSFNFAPEVLSTVLIQLFEIGPKHFSTKFINSSPELKKCYNTLLRYRQVFSHYVLTGKEYKDSLENFKKEFLGFIMCLHCIDLSQADAAVREEYHTYNLIERDKSDFFNYKHEQYLRVSNDTYVGKKIHYSSHNPKSKSLIAILPGGNNSANILYYKKDANDYLTPKFTIDEKSGKKNYIHALNKPIKGTKEAKIDFNLTNIFKAYFKLRKLKNNSDISIFFAPCEENGNYAHYDDIETVILRFFNQGYLPIELLQKTKLDCSKCDRGIITLLNEKDNVIASIVNKQKKHFDVNSKKDEKGFFSRIDDINHDFSKRRHKK